MSNRRVDNLRRRFQGIVFGGDYNPEQWPRDVWDEDVALMKEAGVNLVSLGVFSWSALEINDGEFDFEWLDEAMDLLGANGISVNLATPNASPPPWLATQHPETLMVERDGTRVSVGSRGHFCPSSPMYRDRSRRMAHRLGERYASHPALAMWHIGNEYHSNCFCDYCDSNFRRWLQAKYENLAVLNERWGTTLWGQCYSDWSQVHLPKPVRGSVNPARELDFARFNSNLQKELFVAEKHILLSATPDVPVTTNFMQFFPLNDYHRWAPELDVVSFDSYPDPRRQDAFIRAAFNFDLMRSIGGGEPWYLLEQAANAVSQWSLNLVRQPGTARLGSYQALAHGADAIMFFQWRASRFGQEKFHSAMLPHGGTETRSWQEVRRLGNELRELKNLTGARSEADVAIVWDWENWWAVEGVAHPDNGFNYPATVMRHYAPLWKAGVGVDVITLDADLSAYKALIVPNQYAISPEQQAVVEKFIDNGGHVLISYFSGIVDHDDMVIANGYPGGLRSIIGAHIRELSPLVPEDAVKTSGEQDSGLPAVFSASSWQDDLVLESGHALAHYGDGYLQGQPAIVENLRGAGSATYLASEFDEAVMEAIVRRILDRAGTHRLQDAPLGVEVAERKNQAGTFLFLLNHSEAAAGLTLQRAGRDLITGDEYAANDPLHLSGRDVAVIFSPAPSARTRRGSP